MKSGPENNIPKVVATVPAMMRNAFGFWSLGCANARQPSPTASKPAPAPAKRCAGLGGDGRPDNAVTIDDRAAARAGHQAAATAATTARTIEAAIAHHGRWNRSTRCPTSVSKRGANAIHVTSPTTAPAPAPTTPTTAPLATIDMRTWRSVAPSAPSMPSARILRCAMTAKPAAATRPTNSSPMVSNTSTTIAAAVLLKELRVPMPVAPPTGRKLSTCALVASNRIVTCAAEVIWPGATSANSSFRSNGFSTSPTTLRLAPLTANAPPVCTLKVAAASLVSATSPEPRGNRPATSRSVGCPNLPLGSWARTSSELSDPGIGMRR